MNEETVMNSLLRIKKMMSPPPHEYYAHGPSVPLADSPSKLIARPLVNSKFSPSRARGSPLRDGQKLAMNLGNRIREFDWSGYRFPQSSSQASPFQNYRGSNPASPNKGSMRQKILEMERKIQAQQQYFQRTEEQLNEKLEKYKRLYEMEVQNSGEHRQIQSFDTQTKTIENEIQRLKAENARLRNSQFSSDTLQEIRSLIKRLDTVEKANEEIINKLGVKL